MIKALRSDVGHVPLDFLCKHFSVSRSGNYAHCSKTQSKAFIKKQKVCNVIKAVLDRSDRTYGSPRIYKELISPGHRAAENTVAKYMKELKLDARLKKKYRVMTTDSHHNSPIADRLIKTEDEHTLPSSSGSVLAGDITYLKYGNKFLYLAVVLDLFTREVIGWSMQKSMHSKLVLDALEAAMKAVGPDAQVIFHSDRGSQYASEAYRNFCHSKDILPSMSRRGNCYDNAYVESFFASLKKERVYRAKPTTEAEMRREVFDYIEAWYNPRRLHSSLDYMSLMAFRELHHAAS